jgi:hypothetical protein
MQNLPKNHQKSPKLSINLKKPPQPAGDSLMVARKQSK